MSLAQRLLDHRSVILLSPQPKKYYDSSFSSSSFSSGMSSPSSSPTHHSIITSEPGCGKTLVDNLHMWLCRTRLVRWVQRRWTYYKLILRIMLNPRKIYCKRQLVPVYKEFGTNWEKTGWALCRFLDHQKKIVFTVSTLVIDSSSSLSNNVADSSSINQNKNMVDSNLNLQQQQQETAMLLPFTETHVSKIVYDLHSCAANVDDMQTMLFKIVQESQKLHTQLQVTVKQLNAMSHALDSILLMTRKKKDSLLQNANTNTQVFPQRLPVNEQSRISSNHHIFNINSKAQGQNQNHNQTQSHRQQQQPQQQQGEQPDLHQNHNQSQSRDSIDSDLSRKLYHMPSSSSFNFDFKNPHNSYLNTNDADNMVSTTLNSFSNVESIDPTLAWASTFTNAKPNQATKNTSLCKDSSLFLPPFPVNDLASLGEKAWTEAMELISNTSLKQKQQQAQQQE